jgi:hypothetical protein
MAKKVIYSKANRTINAGYAASDKIAKNLSIEPGLNSVDEEIIEVLLKNKIFKAYIETGMLIISDKVDGLPIGVKSAMIKGKSRTQVQDA